MCMGIIDQGVEEEVSLGLKVYVSGGSYCSEVVCLSLDITTFSLNFI